MNTLSSHGMWTRIFLYPEKKSCGFKNIRICVDRASQTDVKSMLRINFRVVILREDFLCQILSTCLHNKISIACLAILLRYKLHEILPSVTYLLQTFVAIFLLPQSLRKVEVSSTFRNAFRNIARNFSHVAQCNTFPATCVATFNDIGESNCSFCAREV